MPPTAEELLFALALTKPATARAAFLDRECVGDSALRQRLEPLLAAHEAKGSLLKEPVRRPVALKAIKLGMDTKRIVARFEAERQALANLMPAWRLMPFAFFPSLCRSIT